MILGDRVIIITTPAYDPDDPYGGPPSESQWAEATRREVRAEVQPLGSTERFVSEVGVISRWRLILYPQAIIGFTDRVEWRGEEFEVDGDIGEWVISGRVEHLETALKKVDR